MTLSTVPNPDPSYLALPLPVLTVENDGDPIAPEDLPRIFEKGFTGFNGRTDKKSTGIGLYLTKRILTKLSHSIEIHSQVGKGTKVLIHLEQTAVTPELL